MEYTEQPHHFTFGQQSLATLTGSQVAQYAPPGFFTDTDQIQAIVPEQLEVNGGVFTQNGRLPFPLVTVQQTGPNLHVSCTCGALYGQLCPHEALVLSAILQRENYLVFFSQPLRDERIAAAAAAYGLEREHNPGQYFTLEWRQQQALVTPTLPGLQPVTRQHMGQLLDLLQTEPEQAPNHLQETEAGYTTCIVLRQHKYYKHLVVELYKAPLTTQGQIKNSMTPLVPLDFIWTSDDPAHVKFFTGIHKFQQMFEGKATASDLAALRAIVRNPGRFPFYLHDSTKSENVTAASVTPVKVADVPQAITLSVVQQGHFLALSGTINIQQQQYPLHDINTRFDYFLELGNILYLTKRLQTLGIIRMLRQSPSPLLVHASRFDTFKTQILDPLEDQLTIDYPYIPPASSEQLEQQGYYRETSRIIYLSDFGRYIMLVPVMQYADVEIPIRTKRRIYGKDERSRQFEVQRNETAEDEFMGLLTRQHPHFEEQLYENDLHYFYLHRDRFLNEDWFLNAFETWMGRGITVLGFSELEGNKLNPNKVKTDIKVRSGLDWFNAEIHIRYGGSKASLKNVRQALRNKSKYVQLDDGTLGILPEDWIEKFSEYFNAGEIMDAEHLHIPKINFNAVENLFDENELDEPVKRDILHYHAQLDDFTKMEDVPVPQGLQATLRHYQQQGLNWLNFLDDFNFGGCLADDMGLGKSIQIIAFILLQPQKVKQNTNLLVVPATLIFNWQQELARFAPSIKLLTLYGPDRIRDTTLFDNYEVILTSYTTLLSDINFLKHYTFNYVFLDESQYIKNPNTQRYKTVCQLQARNRIVITGTPVENNTYDLYGQLSFACPGLLGSRQYFKDVYATPIDTFKDRKRAEELQRKVQPFILRRTKQEVASELPEKTEMVLYCELSERQREIYNAYERQFRDYISATTGDMLDRHQVHVLKGLTQLRLICNAPILLGNDEITDGPSAKLELLIEQLETQTPDHKILVFSQFTSMLNLVAQELRKKHIGYNLLTGSTRNREAEVQSFRQDERKRVFLISLKAGGTGLNLTEADYVYLIDPWWNPAVENQAIDRVYRIGQHQKVIAVRLICKQTVEEKILLMQESKRNLSGNLIQANGSFFKNLDKQGLLELLNG